MKHKLSRTAGFLAAVLALSGGLLAGFANRAEAQTILEDQGTLEPAQQEYSIEVEAGDVVAVVMSSEDFDTVLTLLGPDGEEVAFNDDFGGTLNSLIVYSVPVSGSYTVVTKSFDGQGGDYDLEVRPATEYEVSYSEAQISLQEGNYEAAISAYSQAIELEPENPEGYLGRADAYFGAAQAALEAEGQFLETPNDLPEEMREAIVADFEVAAELYEAEGDPFTAQSLREQIEYIETGEFPGPAEGGER
ncbi:MAG: tetratricopeptide repeat protein [Leptolyngbya sp. SIO1E4]|nr:tetratricopeptide repeat protein [Leptolyngbya sp. SIO1E4]